MQLVNVRECECVRVYVTVGSIRSSSLSVLVILGQRARDYLSMYITLSATFVG